MHRAQRGKGTRYNTDHELQDVRALDISIGDDVGTDDLDAAWAATVTAGHLTV
jgi:hypothetical protein